MQAPYESSVLHCTFERFYLLCQPHYVECHSQANPSVVCEPSQWMGCMGGTREFNPQVPGDVVVIFGDQEFWRPQNTPVGQGVS